MWATQGRQIEDNTRESGRHRGCLLRLRRDGTYHELQSAKLVEDKTQHLVSGIGGPSIRERKLRRAGCIAAKAQSTSSHQPRQGLWYFALLVSLPEIRLVDET